MLIRTCVLLMSQFSMKNYTKVGNLDESQISIVNKKLNPTLRKPENQIAFTFLRFSLTNIAQYVPVIQELIRRHWPLEDFDSKFLASTHYSPPPPPFFQGSEPTCLIPLAASVSSTDSLAESIDHHKALAACHASCLSRLSQNFPQRSCR